MRTSISRREFLKFCSLGFVGLMFPENLLSKRDVTHLKRSLDLPLGRIQLDKYPCYEAPSFDADIIREMALDSVHEITGITVSQQGSSVNRMWYELDGAGYAHSSRVQPVRMRFNPSETFMPENGCVGEITVPWVDAFSGVDEHRKKRYRLYYASTLWVTKRVTDADGGIWYELLDDRYYTKLYVPAYSVRLVPDSELTALSPQVPYEHKKLIVDLDHQTLTAYIDDKPITNFRVSTGAYSLEGGFATPKGAYRTSLKRPSRHMYAPPSEFGTGFDLPGVPWVSYFTGDGIALHGTYWHNDFGVPHSHGCINLTPQAAKWVYRWTTPNVPPDQYVHADNQATRVVIQ